MNSMAGRIGTDIAFPARSCPPMQTLAGEAVNAGTPVTMPLVNTLNEFTAGDLVQLRYFSGLSIPEAARVLRISPRTANRIWTYARAWLHQEMEGSGPAKEES